MSFYEQADNFSSMTCPARSSTTQHGNFIVNPAVTGYTPTASEFEWPGVHSLAHDHRQDGVTEQMA